MKSELLWRDLIIIFTNFDLWWPKITFEQNSAKLIFEAQGSASWTGSPRSRSPGTWNLGPGLGQGLKFKISGSETGTGTQIYGTRDSGTQLCGTVPGTGNFPGNSPGPVPTLFYTKADKWKNDKFFLTQLKQILEIFPVCRQVPIIISWDQLSLYWILRWDCMDAIHYPNFSIKF